MSMKFALFVVMVIIAPPVSAAVPVSGKWMTQERDSIVEIASCGSTVCGKVLRVLKMMPNGKAPIDLNNPDPALRNRPVQGILIFRDFTDAGSHWNGRLYDPKSGKSYRSKLTRNPDGTLKVQGCIGFLCKSFTWTAVK
jgi:uncharacterized protein (DUF2147 family)